MICWDLTSGCLWSYNLRSLCENIGECKNLKALWKLSEDFRSNQKTAEIVISRFFSLKVPSLPHIYWNEHFIVEHVYYYVIYFCPKSKSDMHYFLTATNELCSTIKHTDAEWMKNVNKWWSWHCYSIYGLGLLLIYPAVLHLLMFTLLFPEMQMCTRIFHSYIKHYIELAKK